MVKELQTKRFKLARGDVIRLGKVDIQVSELRDSYIEPDSLVEDLPNMPVEDSHACRICLVEEATADNPLIAPCNCSGTIGIIHITCLQQWLSSKLAIREMNNSISYSWKTLECELCKFKYPNAIAVCGKVHELLNIRKPEGNYLGLELIPKENNKHVLYLIGMNNKKNVRLGRATEADVRVTDISISREHATIKKSRGGLYIEDNGSKFGTLIHIKESVIVTENLAVQCGRTIVSFSLRRQIGCGDCIRSCFCVDHSDRKDIIKNEM